MAIHSSILSWRIPWRGEPGELQFIGLHRVGHDRSDLTHNNMTGFLLLCVDFLRLRQARATLCWGTLWFLLLLRSTCSRHGGFSSCGAQV